MSTQKLLILLAGVAAIGVAAWYWSGQMDAPNMEDGETEESETTQNEGDDKQSDSKSNSTSASASGGASSQATVEDSSSIEGDLAAIDSLNESESDYDDSDLDSTFSSEGSNSLTQQYDY